MITNTVQLIKDYALPDMERQLGDLHDELAELQTQYDQESQSREEIQRRDLHTKNEAERRLIDWELRERFERWPDWQQSHQE
jgi:hypothetical protein